MRRILLRIVLPAAILIVAAVCNRQTLKDTQIVKKEGPRFGVQRFTTTEEK